MNTLLPSLKIVATLTMVLGSLNFVLANCQNDSPTIEWALDNPDKITPEFLKKPENAELRAKLKERALSKPTMDAVVPFLNLGDPDVTRDCIRRYRSRSVSYFPDQALAKSNNPDIIPLIGEDLNRKESADAVELHGEDIMLQPLSVSAGTIIRAIILQSSSFPPAVQS